ncbi:YggS family pyridoxal phosphate-dependent enzyme [Bacteroidota bacterium]
MSISENLKQVLSTIPPGVKLVAVSKTKPNKDIMAAYNAGHKIFGENKVQDLARKYDELPKDIEWHMIGHLQSNKVKYIAPFVDMIEAVDSMKLLKLINKEAIKNNRVINCLLQIHIAEEEEKFGFNTDEIIEILNSREFKEIRNIKICGLMGMSTFTYDEDQVKKEFFYLKKCFDKIKPEYFPNDPDFKEISMGMSGDYKIAIEQGSTMVRIGSSIFGSRH